jgi:hypothetical protein
MLIHISSFVRRQTAASQYSHWNISDEELIRRVEDNLGKAHKGYRNGVILVPVNPERFFSATVALSPNDTLCGEYVSRREGEEPRKAIYANGSKSPAKTVWVVLYALIAY